MAWSDRLLKERRQEMAALKGKREGEMQEQRGLTVAPKQQQAVTAFDENNVFSLANAFVQSGYFKDTTSVSQAIVKMLAGREAGFGPMASIMGIHIVQGKPTYSANLIATAIKRSGRYNYVVKKLDNEGCVLDFTEHGKRLGESSFTVKDAQAAGLASKDTWKNYPRNLCFARALTNGCKWFCSDVFGGIDAEVSEGTDTEMSERERSDMEARKREDALEAVAPVNGIFRPTDDPQEDAKNAAFAAQYADMTEDAEQSPLLPEPDQNGQDVSDKEKLDIISEQLNSWRQTWTRCVTEAAKKNMRVKLEHAVSVGYVLPEVREVLRRECKGLYEA